MSIRYPDQCLLDAKWGSSRRISCRLDQWIIDGNMGKVTTAQQRVAVTRLRYDAITGGLMLTAIDADKPAPLKVIPKPSTSALRTSPEPVR
jgi:hypothetical protein